MQVGDLPHGATRFRLARAPIYLPSPHKAAPRRERAFRRVVAVGLAAVVALAASAGRTGDQGVLAAVAGERPLWAVPLRAPDPGVSFSPHLAFGNAEFAAVATGTAPAAPAASSKADRPMTQVSRVGAGTMAPLAGLLAAADASALPRVAFVQPKAREGGEGRGRHEPAAVAEAALTSMLSAYAPERVDIEAPFAALLGGEPPAPRPWGVSGNGLDHWWSDRPLPESVRSEEAIECLAKAVYFEARGESEAGQKAVAQVVINRVKNPAYPDDVCAVVFQNRTWFNRCQFTFACDRIADVVRDRAAWEQALRIATAYANEETWLPEVGAATHYHADYVSPAWGNVMRRVKTIDRHIFYVTLKGGWT